MRPKLTPLEKANPSLPFPTLSGSERVKHFCCSPVTRSQVHKYSAMSMHPAPENADLWPFCILEKLLSKYFWICLDSILALEVCQREVRREVRKRSCRVSFVVLFGPFLSFWENNIIQSSLIFSLISFWKRFLLNKCLRKEPSRSHIEFLWMYCGETVIAISFPPHVTFTSVPIRGTSIERCSTLLRGYENSFFVSPFNSL